MSITSSKWIILAFICALIFLAAGFSDYKQVYNEKSPLVEAVFQILTTNLDQNGEEELILTGKNYIGREFFIYWMGLSPEFKPVVKWQSINLFEEQSLFWVASGRFTSMKNQLLAMTNSQYYLFQFENNSLNLIKQSKHSLQPLRINASVSAGDLNGDGRDELVVAKIGQVKNNYYDSKIQIWQFKEDKFEFLYESGLLANIRGMTVGDLDGDGLAEIVVEEGIRTEPGDLHLLKVINNKLNEIYILKKPTKGAIYALQVNRMPEGTRLITASDHGRVNTFAWINNTLVPVEKELVFNYAWVALAVSDLNGDKNQELILAGYPNQLLILNKR